MIFNNRYSAGLLLAKRLVVYSKNKDFLVFGIPRGGVVTANVISKLLHLRLKTLITRKIPAPDNNEMAIGAIGPRGTIILDRELIERLHIDSFLLKKQIEEAKIKLQDYTLKFKSDGRALKCRKVILVDDGIATGASVEVAVKYLKKAKVKEIILAVPVAPSGTSENFKGRVDKVIILSEPDNFSSVGQFYRDFPQVSDQDVIELLDEANSRIRKSGREIH